MRKLFSLITACQYAVSETVDNEGKGEITSQIDLPWDQNDIYIFTRHL